MSRWDSMVSSGAWDRLVSDYRDAGGESADDFTLAELLRNHVREVEGDD